MRNYIRPAALQLLILTVLISCKELPDQYRVFDDVSLMSVDYNKNVFMCKLACETDAKIPDVKSIAWSDKVMYLTQQKFESEEYFIILAKGEELMCCNNDSTIGPLTFEQFKDFKKAMRLPDALANKKEY